MVLIGKRSLIMKAYCLLPYMLLLLLTSCGTLTSERTTTVMTTQASNQTVAPINAPTNAVQEPALVFFTSEPGKFQVWLPASESVLNYTIKKTLFGESIECPILVFRLNGAYATVQYCDLVPQSIATLSSDEIIDQARSEIIRGMNVKLETQERVLAQDIYPATMLSGQVDMRGMGYDGTFQARIILVESRIYLIVMSVYHENWCNCLHQINQVVDSLYIDPGLSIPFEPTP
jgi:hypothetical protein